MTWRYWHVYSFIEYTNISCSRNTKPSSRRASFLRQTCSTFADDHRRKKVEELWAHLLNFRMRLYRFVEDVWRRLYMQSREFHRMGRLLFLDWRTWKYSTLLRDIDLERWETEKLSKLRSKPKTSGRKNRRQKTMTWMSGGFDLPLLLFGIYFLW